MSQVLVLSSDGQPLDSCHPARARRLLSSGRAAVWRRYPFTIRLKHRTAQEFGHPHIQAQARLPLKDAAAVNSTRWALYRRLVASGLPVEGGTGGMTKFNRTRLGLPKAHWTDAACVGASTPEGLDGRGVRPLLIRATGHGSRQLCRMD
jgi:hypothetical protein